MGKRKDVKETEGRAGISLCLFSFKISYESSQLSDRSSTKISGFDHF